MIHRLAGLFSPLFATTGIRADVGRAPWLNVSHSESAFLNRVFHKPSNDCPQPYQPFSPAIFKPHRRGLPPLDGARRSGQRLRAI
jgi:hypothetical protein